MGQMTVSQLLVQCLEAEGIDMVSGIIDGAHVPLIVELDRHGIRYINVRHEEAAVHVAEGYARMTRKPGVVIGNPACGTGNMLAGVMSAHGEGHPIVAIGTTRNPIKAVPNRGGAWQSADTENMARPITKYSETVRQWERLPEMFRAAFRAATTGRPGPAYLQIPDVLLATVFDADKAPPVYPADRYRVTDMGAGDPSAIEKAAELLANSERPYIHAGKGVQWADGSDELVALGEYLAAPMTSTVGARGVIPEDHAQCLHPLDIEGGGLARSEADVLLIVGARLGEYDGFGMPPLWGDPSTQTTIHIDSDPMSIGLNRPVDLAVVADARAALAALLAAVKAKTGPRAEVADKAKHDEASAATMDQAMAYLGEEGTTGVNPGMMALTVRGLFPPETITVLDGGNTTLVSTVFHPILKPQSFLLSVKMGYLGTGLPMAIGAKLAAPERPVCLISGDGAFGFNMMELETAAREKVPIIAIVGVDSAWGMEKSAFFGHGFEAKDWEKSGIELAPVRYDLAAEALGCHGEMVDAIDQLAPAVERAIASGKPAVIHVQVDQELNTRPPGLEQFGSLLSGD
jgi:acetolactate synthase-1/2/3 large subunit